MDYFAALRAFVRSVDLGSFSRAAEEQNAKVSTISRQVRWLEADVGAALLNRSTRRLHLTEAGSTLYGRATRILSDLADARTATQELNATPQGLLRVTVPAAFGRRHVIPHLPDFLRTYPEVAVDLMLEDRTLDLIDMGLDLAIRIGTLSDSSLVAKRLGPHERVLIASPAYLQRNNPVRTPDDLGRLDCLSFALQKGAVWYCRPRGSAPGEPPRALSINGRLRINDTDALLRAAVDGLGVALLPRWAVADAVGRNELAVLLHDWTWELTAGMEPAIWCVYPPKKIVSPKVRAFINFIADRIASENGW